MSSEIAIQADDLGKHFDSFRHPAGHLLKQFFPVQARSQFWALRNVHFEVFPGQCLGIVGRNGSGKSTLLSLLAGTLTPSEGSAEIRGRVVALLELGAGFHPDFTGRENVFLAASLYGLSASQVTARMRQIEGLADIGGFIDRPVREYSSGMFARLAFAVAAHVDADILIVDEILGVGDFKFQQRCAEFIRRFRQHGVVILVSHSEHAILSLCTHTIWLEGGRIVLRGSPRVIMHAYHTETARLTAAPVGAFEADGHPFNLSVPGVVPAVAELEHGIDFDHLPVPVGGASILSCWLESVGEALGSASGGEEAVLAVRFRLDRSVGRPLVGFAVRDSLGETVLATESCELGLTVPTSGAQLEAKFTFELPYLPSGTYAIDLVLFDCSGRVPQLLAREPIAQHFSVLSQHVSAGLANSAPAAAELRINGMTIAP
ncbi:ABC transporter ATP-binding protein [Devosia sp. CAU 1758]